MECDDFSQFQEALEKLRTLDDRLIYALNAKIPTVSFRGGTDAAEGCRELHSQIKSGHARREEAIKKCILVGVDRVKELRESGDARALRAEQTKVRMLRSELSVEEVVRERTMKLFSEKCRDYYKPSPSS